MMGNFEVRNGSGRATCQICGDKIEKGINNQVTFFAYRIQKSVHRDCIINWEKVKLVQSLIGGEE